MSFYMNFVDYEKKDSSRG